MSESRLRLIKQLSSSIFSQQPHESWFKPSKKLARDASDSGFAHGGIRNQSPCSPYLKPADHGKSDLFGSFPSQFYRKDVRGIYDSPVIKPKKIQIFDKVNNRLFCASKNIESRSVTPNQPPGYVRPIVRPQIRNEINSEAKIETISIEGLPKHHDSNNIKMLCQGMHLVNINTEIDNFTGECLGKATVSVRSNSAKQVENLKLKLVNQGYSISTIAAKNGKRNNFHTSGIHFLNSKLQQEEKRLIGNTLTSKERKMALLASSDEVFGNSSSRYGENTERLASLREDRKNQESFRMWQLTKSVCQRSPANSRSFSFDYFRPTISSSNKAIRKV